jgi:hypothetical protein
MAGNLNVLLRKHFADPSLVDGFLFAESGPRWW